MSSFEAGSWVLSGFPWSSMRSTLWVISFSVLVFQISLLCGSGRKMFDSVFVLIACPISLLNSPYRAYSGSVSSKGSVNIFLVLPPSFMMMAPLKN